MLVYMLLNEATDMCYIGKTEGSLQARWEEHLRWSESGRSNMAVTHAIAEWGPDVWSQVVLQHCHTTEELNLAEGNWIRRCESDQPNIGYNMAHVPSADERRAKELATVRLVSRRDEEYYRECGRMATAKYDKEFYRECGRRGAAKSKASATSPPVPGTTLRPA